MDDADKIDPAFDAKFSALADRCDAFGQKHGARAYVLVVLGKDYVNYRAGGCNCDACTGAALRAVVDAFDQPEVAGPEAAAQAGGVLH
jgi:hypothetical protein